MIPRFIETSDFYLSFFVIMGLLFFVAAPLQWLMNFYFGLKGGIVSCFVLALLAALVWLFLYQFGRNMGSIGGHVSFSGGELWSLFMGAFIISLVLSLLMNYGVHHLVQFRKTGELNKLLFFSWLAFILGVPALSVLKHELSSFQSDKYRKENFVNTHLEIFHYSELPIDIDELKFVNSATGRESKIFGIYVSKFYTAEESEGERIPIDDRVLYDEHRYENLPVGFDQFLLSWYSFVEEKYYSDTFPFPSEQFPVEIRPDGSKSMMSIHLLIQAGGKVKLFDGRRTHFIPYEKVAVKPLEKEEKERKLEIFHNANRTFESREALMESLRKIRDSDYLEKRMEMEEEEFSWKLSFEGPGEISKMRIKDFRHLRYDTTYNWLHQTSRKSLPAKISFYYKPTELQAELSLSFNLSKLRLYQRVKALTSVNENLPLEFVIQVPEADKKKINFLIRSEGQELAFEDFEVKVVD